MGHPAAGVQRQHAPAVLANQLQPADRWGRPCRAYNVYIRPSPDAAAALATIQESALRLEPSLLRVPEQAQHANLTWLLPVHKEFGAPKDDLWQQHGPEWTSALADAASRTSTFSLRYRRLAATNSAIITVADEPNGLSALRRELVPLLRLPGGASAGDLVHMTLFRYSGPLHDPAALLRWIAATEFRVDVHVSELLIIRERVFPSLDFDILHRFALASEQRGLEGPGLRQGRQPPGAPLRGTRWA